MPGSLCLSCCVSFCLEKIRELRTPVLSGWSKMSPCSKSQILRESFVWETTLSSLFASRCWINIMQGDMHKGKHRDNGVFCSVAMQRLKSVNNRSLVKYYKEGFNVQLSCMLESFPVVSETNNRARLIYRNG